MRGVLLAIATAAGLLLAWWMVTPPAPRAPDASPYVFSAGRAMTDVRAIARAPHPVGSAEDRRVVAYLARRLASLGLEVALQPVPLPAKSLGKLAEQTRAPVPAAVTGTNVLGLVRGRDRGQPAVLLMAHHDTVGGSPGAADDTAGVAAILEVLRALRLGPPPARDIIVLFTDAEEMGLVGAKTFFASPLRDHVGFVLNLETRGGGGRALMFETSAGNGALMRGYARVVPEPSATSLSVFVYRLLPNSTDLTPALKSGVAGMNFAFTGRAALYHSPLATPDRIDPASIQDMGAQALAMTRALMLAPALPPRTPDLVFADVLGARVLAYPPVAGWLLLAVTLALAALAVVRAARAGAVTRMAVRDGLGLPVVLLSAAVPLLLVNRLSGAGDRADYYDRLAALPRLEAQAALVCVAALLLAAGWRRIGRWGGWLAMAGLLFVAAVVVQVTAPTAAPVLHWPLALAALAMAIAAWLDPALESADALAPGAVIAAFGMGQVLGFGHLLFLSIGAPMPVVALVALLPAAAMAWPLLHGVIRPRDARLASGVALLLAIGLAAWVRLDPMAASVPVYVTDKR